MIRGLYTAAAGMLSGLVATDTLANNLANVNTVGFKTNRVNFKSFPAIMLQRMNAQGQVPIGSISTGSAVYGSSVDFTAGAVKPTGNPFDLALEGDGFFEVRNAQGDLLYTRAGNFIVNEDGYLTTLSGEILQGNGGDIRLDLAQGPFEIGRSGVITSRQGVVDRIKVMSFSDRSGMEKVGNALFRPLSGNDPILANPQGVPGATSIHQGHLEMSNVNPVSELVNNIQGMRLYEALQKSIQMNNETLGKAVNDVGRIR